MYANICVFNANFPAMKHYFNEHRLLRSITITKIESNESNVIITIIIINILGEDLISQDKNYVNFN